MTTFIRTSGTRLDLAAEVDDLGDAIYSLPGRSAADMRETTRLVVRVAPDGLAHPLTTGNAAEQLAENAVRVERVASSLTGWGDHDCGHHWVIDGVAVPGHVVAAFERLAGCTVREQPGEPAE